ncbi:CCA tRNA nucleotidyltransferase [Phyllobacterium endophyticum]|uniref:CCA tRNA nucleotidyltransferase n=1 Tax=Phyllobacterium endophyticum TaxID=1149773 RepID=A0A2P7APK3_9HYPH|nr:CCA tRNA nucleotidyltransferase [Phyllobacterium endophyticum]MBB3233462.1 tRNA nucleotidyltransferase/poly(A) polymerase [Phyllobacterium endophyticum]PSH56140.1 CCA tRNA nucleotidyltransferase [Phyllobacterium endophyticum]TYR41306.1 CCA tRNA nucleotidyltransferase [Phyllobacterium endophyticum]
MSSTVSIAGKADWLEDPSLQRLLSALAADGEAARIVGGAVRNTLLGQEVSDIDIATTCPPGETSRRAAVAGFKVVPTGIDHGTITVVADGKAFEVTTLRADLETDGRHAEVAYGRDWHADASRRDFTINALYADADGTVVDLVGGLADIESRTLRFIGDPEQRIREDYLRILRFFRFFAWYGRGRPESEGLKACARMKDGLTRLSAERIWTELKKLLSAPDPSRALLWMRQAGVLTVALPESEKWGIDTIHALVKAEQDLKWEADALLRLESIIPPQPDRIADIAEKLKLSNSERGRLEAWAATTSPQPDISEPAFAKILYRCDKQGMRDRLRLALVTARAGALNDDAAMRRAGYLSKLLDYLEIYEKPIFPISGGDIVAAGFKKGPEIGAVQRALEDEWIRSGFTLERDKLLNKIPEYAGKA